MVRVRHLWILPRFLHDGRQEIPVAVARVDQLVQEEDAVAEPRCDLHDLPELVLRRLVKMGQLRRLPRLVHDKRQEIPLAVARVDQLV